MRNMAEIYQQQKDITATRAAVLGKWLWILFWLFVPVNIAGLLKTDKVLDLSPGLYIAGQVLSVSCSVVYGAVLVRLSSAEKKYHTAGLLVLISAAASALFAVFSGTGKVPVWAQSFNLIIGMISSYAECAAHSSVLAGVDNRLSEAWDMLRKWYLYCAIGTAGGVLLILMLAPLLGLLVSLAALLGVLVLSIISIVYLYQTAKACRNYPSAEADIKR